MHILKTLVHLAVRYHIFSQSNFSIKLTYCSIVIVTTIVLHNIMGNPVRRCTYVFMLLHDIQVTRAGGEAHTVYQVYSCIQHTCQSSLIGDQLLYIQQSLHFCNGVFQTCFLRTNLPPQQQKLPFARAREEHVLRVEWAINWSVSTYSYLSQSFFHSVIHSTWMSSSKWLL